ncbi:hypothetical protein [Hyalangium gracile]|uniref:hypothetical protein n=1 Tax=Hyalangium gracile TaxID=394092 RepID=UPI001CCED294|nr:hypothetical protein [Hyalangium gracile]
MLDRDNLKGYFIVGTNMQAIMNGFGSFTLIASKLLLREGIGTPDESMIAQFEPTAWYPLDRVLRVFDHIQEEFGDFTVRQVGLQVFRTQPLPPQIVDLTSAFEGLNFAYKMVHGKGTVPLFNPATGEMKDDLGHYKWIHTKGTNKGSVESTSIYPCPFDEGLMSGAAQRFKPTATITHDRASCRSRGGDKCIYQISWK